MIATKQINVKNKTHYFHDIKHFDSSSLILNKKTFKNISMYYIGYIRKKDEYEISGMGPIYLFVHKLERFIEEKEESKYLNIAYTDNNSEVLKNMKNVGVELIIALKK